MALFLPSYLLKINPKCKLQISWKCTIEPNNSKLSSTGKNDPSKKMFQHDH